MLKQVIFNKIKIIGKAKKDLRKIAEALLFIRQDPQSNELVSKLRTIAIEPQKTYDNEVFPETRIWVCQLGTVRECSVHYLASLIVHEAFHVDQYERGLINIDSQNEPDAYKKQIEFLRRHNADWDADHVEKLMNEKQWFKDLGPDYDVNTYVSPFLKYIKTIKRSKIETLTLRDIGIEK